MAADFHAALLDAYAAGDNLPPLWDGVAPEKRLTVVAGVTAGAPYAVLGEETPEPVYDSGGTVLYTRVRVTLTVYDLTDTAARAAAAAVAAALTPGCLDVTGKTARLYQGGVRVRPTGDRGPLGEFLYAAALPLDAEIS